MENVVIEDRQVIPEENLMISSSEVFTRLYVKKRY